MDVFKNVMIRAFYEDIEGRWWFSAVDLTALLTGSDHKAARKYWSVFRPRFRVPLRAPDSQPQNMGRFRADDGRIRSTEVLDMREVLHYIAEIPSPAALKYKQWLADAAMEGTAVQQLTEFAQACAEHTATSQDTGRGRMHRLEVERITKP
jgi:hypothetical protein